MDTNSSVGLAVGAFLVLFIAYLYLESRENDARGNKHFSPQKLGKVLKKTFTLCLPDCALLACANVLIFCGFVGNSCMENIHSDEDIRESKKMARLAATLSRSKGSKSSKKKSKHKRDRVEDGAEEALFSGSDLSDLENGSVDSGHRRSRNGSRKSSSSSKSKSHHTRSEDMERSDYDFNMSDHDNGHNMEVSGHSYKDLTHTRPNLRSPLPVPVSDHEEPMSRAERRDNRLNLSQHSARKTKTSAVSRESLQAMIAAEDNALGNRQVSV